MNNSVILGLSKSIVGQAVVHVKAVLSIEALGIPKSDAAALVTAWEQWHRTAYQATSWAFPADDVATSLCRHVSSGRINRQNVGHVIARLKRLDHIPVDDNGLKVFGTPPAAGGEDITRTPPRPLNRRERRQQERTR